MTQEDTSAEDVTHRSETPPGDGHKIAVVSLTEEACVGYISLLIDEHLEHSGLLKTVNNRDGTYDVYVVE